MGRAAGAMQKKDLILTMIPLEFTLAAPARSLVVDLASDRRCRCARGRDHDWLPNEIFTRVVVGGAAAG